MILFHRSASIVFFMIFLLSIIMTNGQDASNRVLFLGNSVFYSRGGLCPTFEGFCRQAGLDYQAVSQWKKPSSPHGIEFLDHGRIPLNLPEVAADRSIHDLIRLGNFDFVILEARRVGYLLPAHVDLPESRGKHIPYRQNFEALSSLHRTIVNSGGQMVLYMHPGAHNALDIKHPVAQVYQRLHIDLEKKEIDGKEHEVILVPAMLLWLDALHQYGEDGWYADLNHGNALARYASACMLFTYITGVDPRKNDFNKLTELTPAWHGIPGMSNLVAKDDDANWIKDQVWLYYLTRPR
ncbi:MAG: hypothetical protein HKN87_16875 [Saprospiraceae bacterium]|nr:hypothetical protein [Saprospiraceae bacterium]